MRSERRYAQIEKEALATTWVLEHWADLLIGMHFRVETDLPLVPLLSTKLLDELPIRIQRFRMRLMRYSFSIAHVIAFILLLFIDNCCSSLHGHASFNAHPSSHDFDAVHCYEVICFCNPTQLSHTVVD